VGFEEKIYAKNDTELALCERERVMEYKSPTLVA
jgi:hypothetical protein